MVIESPNQLKVYYKTGSFIIDGSVEVMCCKLDAIKKLSCNLMFWLI